MFGLQLRHSPLTACFCRSGHGVLFFTGDHITDCIGDCGGYPHSQSTQIINQSTILFCNASIRPDHRIRSHISLMALIVTRYSRGRLFCDYRAGAALDPPISAPLDQAWVMSLASCISHSRAATHSGLATSCGAWCCAQKYASRRSRNLSRRVSIASRS